MNFNFAADIDKFRAEVKDFIAKELPPPDEQLEPGLIGGGQRERDYTVDFQKKLAERGWLAMAWPQEYGGGGASYMHQVVYNEEMAYAGAPVTNQGIQWIGPTLMILGTDEQKQQFLPRITGVEDWWCTMYSEPGAGSDLASLQTKAVRDGDDYVINGQKIWTSSGHMADWGWLAARTNPDVPKHKGITMFLLDLKTPGISIRPLVNLADRHIFNEVFFEDVRIPASRVVGEVGRGWYHLALALDFERTGIQYFGGARRDVDWLVAHAKGNRAALGGRPAMRLELVDRAIELEVGQLRAYQIAGIQEAGMVPNLEASQTKMFGSELTQRLKHTRIRLLSMTGQLRNGSPYQVVDAATAYMDAIPRTIGGGSSEIQRNIIATRGLGLPRG